MKHNKNKHVHSALLRKERGSGEWFVLLTSGNALSDLAAMHMPLDGYRLSKHDERLVRTLGEAAYALNISGR